MRTLGLELQASISRYNPRVLLMTASSQRGGTENMGVLLKQLEQQALLSNGSNYVVQFSY